MMFIQVSFIHNSQRIKVYKYECKGKQYRKKDTEREREYKWEWMFEN